MTQHKDVFDTPGRECAHARKGCCPKCFDPAGILKSTREFRMKRFRRDSSSPNRHQEHRTNG